jgi:hypothetical protein
MEKGVNNKINFLDLTIDITESQHNFSIFRKPTYTDQVIPSDSCHPTAHKLASFNSLIHRLISIPLSKTNFQRELQTIKYIAIKNGYQESTIDKLLKKKRKKQALNLNTSLSDPSVSKRKWCKIPFHNSISFKIANKFPKDKFRVSFYTPMTLSKALCTNKDHIDSIQKSGVYEIQCECGATYVGQTGRSFQTRIKEHKKGYITGNTTSLFAKHLIDSSHNSEFDFNVLHYMEKGKRLDVMEQIEIIQRQDRNLINEIQFLSSPSPLLSIAFP